MKDETKEELRHSLDELLGYDLPDEVPGLDEAAPINRLPAQSNNTQLQIAKTKATRVLDNLLKLYLSEEIIEQEEYIQAKSELDKSALSMLIRQMENSETAINALMNAIGEGEVTPRMFEVLSDMQRTMLEIIKSQTMYMMAVEENAKKMARDIDIYKNYNTEKSEGSSNSGLRSRGTKDLMKALQNLEDEIEVDTKEDDDENEE